MSGCYYISFQAKAFGWTQLTPAVVTIILMTASRVSNKPFWFWLSLYLYPVQYLTWCFQHYFQQIRPDPICQLYQTFAFPSLEALYIGGALGVFWFSAYYSNYVHSWLTWLVFYLVGIVPPLILVYTLYNTWWEVLFSMGFGFLAALLFIYVLQWFIRPKKKYLLNGFPLLFFGYSDISDPEYRKVYEGLAVLDGRI